MKIRRSEERGYFDFGWLKTYHSFSFGEYFDRNYMHFSDLRVLNHDFIAPSMGFPTHPHKDMEIITYVLNGTVEHQDSMGNKAQIHAGEIQTMSAGAGVFHSEANPSSTETLELIQLWVMPRRKGGKPSYAQKKFSIDERKNKFLKIISGDLEKNRQNQNENIAALPIGQDTEIYASIIEKDQRLTFPISMSKKYWIQVVQGQLKINSEILQKGDALGVESSDQLSELVFKSIQQCEILLFELRSDL